VSGHGDDARIGGDQPAYAFGHAGGGELAQALAHVAPPVGDRPPRVGQHHGDVDRNLPGAVFDMDAGESASIRSRPGRITLHRNLLTIGRYACCCCKP